MHLLVFLLAHIHSLAHDHVKAVVRRVLVSFEKHSKKALEEEQSGQAPKEEQSEQATEEEQIKLPFDEGIP